MRKSKNIRNIIIIVTILVIAIISAIYFLIVKIENDRIETMKNNDALYLRYQKMQQQAKEQNKLWASRSSLVFPAPYNNYEKVYVLDVSYAQQSINWNNVYAAGYKYAIIRIGHRGYGDGNVYADDWYYTNLVNAKAAGIKIGAYFFSEAINESEAEYEANWTADRIHEWEVNTGNKLDLPIFIDFEGDGDGGAKGGRVEANIQWKQDGTNILIKFCETVKNRGYAAGIYSGIYFLDSYADPTQLTNKVYCLWYPNYNANGLYDNKLLSYNYPVDMWQYTYQESVNGITGNVDASVFFVKPLNNVKNITVKRWDSNDSAVQLLFDTDDENSFLNNYEIEIYKNNEYLRTENVDVKVANINGLEEGKYKFKIKAHRNPYGIESTSGWATSEEVELKASVGTMSNVTYTLKNETTATLKWNAVENARGYEVYKQMGGQSDWTLVQDVKITASNPPSQNTLDVSIAVGENRFKVIAYNDDFKDNTVKSQESNKVIITREKQVESITIVKAPTKTTYIKGYEDLDLTDGKIKVNYNNNTNTEISMTASGVTVEGFDNSTVGTKTLTVKYEGKEATFKVVVVNKSLSSIEVSQMPTKTTYIKGTENLNLTGGKLKLNYNDNTNEIIDMTADGVTTEGFSNSEAGEKTITIKYGGKQTTFKVTVVDKTLTSIEVSQMPTKTTYIKGYENLDLAGGKLKLKYNDNTSTEISMTANGVTVEGFSNSEAGEKIITVKYGGKQTTFKVTIVDKTLTSIEVSQMPTKTTYIREYENLDLAGGKLKLKYNDNTSTEISMTANGVTVEGFSNSEAGEKTITVKYGGKQTTFKVTIINDESKAEIVVTGIPDTVAINSCTITIKVTHPRNKITKITVNGNTVESNNGQASYKIKQNGEYTIVATDEYNTETTKQIEINNIYKLGDTTKNNKIELSDLIALIRHIAAKDSKATLKSWILPEDKQMLADVTQDGQLNLSDIIRYKRHLAASSDSNVARKNPNWILPSE